MSDDSKEPADLSTLGIDLSDIFRPAWTVEPSNHTAKLAAKFDEGHRGDRPDRFSSGERGGSSHREDRGRGPRGGKSGEGRGGGRDREARGSRPQFGGGNREAKGIAGGQSAHQGSRSQSRERDGRGSFQDDRRHEVAAKPLLEGWKIDLIPQPSAVEGITKQIRSRAKAYPIFELARLIVNLSDRYSVKLTAESEGSPELFRARTDGSLWTSRKAAIAHLLSKHLDKFYRRSSITTEAPKGSYSVVAQCGMSGVLLGPPNHHEYQSRLLALHASRFKNLPFEVYKTRIKMVRDEALMEQWKSEQSTRTVFIPIPPQAAVTQEPSAIPVLAEQEHSIAGETDNPSDVPNDTVLVEEVVAGSGETLEIPEAGDASESPSEETSEGLTEAAPEPASESSTENASDEAGLSFEEVTDHFNEHHAEAEVEPAGNEITVPGKVALHESDPLIHELLIKTLQELDRFPLPLAQLLGREFAASGLQIYKAQKKIHVSVARPKYLDRATTPTSEGFRKIIDYLEAHPNQHRDKQWIGLLAQITEPAGDTPEVIQQREKALGADLLSLLHQGHVIDFAMGNLQAALRPVPKPAPNTKPTSEKKTTAEKIPSVEIVGQPSVESESGLIDDPETAPVKVAYEANEGNPPVIADSIAGSAIQSSEVTVEATSGDSLVAE